ncbi:RtcB family protein [Candidatus Sumerlaeota bacterium]|nr:RtcB family protein [Candidatus Sumerlaeota bacterium]
MNIKRIDPYRALIPREGNMKIEAMIYISENMKLEEESLQQLRNAASLPSAYKALATPDIHTGFGVPIGCVVAMPNEIIPCAVGYDVNCGMRLLTTPLMKDEIDSKVLADSIRRDIPLGEGKKNLKLTKSELRLTLERGVKGMFDWAKNHERLLPLWNDLEMETDYHHIEDMGSMAGCVEAVSSKALERGRDQLGTLGGGNHFIEIQEVKSVADEKIAQAMGIRKGQVVVMIHSGSRGLGHQIGNDYMPLAAGASREKSPDRTLGFFRADSREGRDYIGAMHAAANFAFVNRQIMAMLARRNFRHYFGNIPMPLVYDVPHNIAKYEKHGNGSFWVHRKGATRAYPPERMKGTQYQSLGQPVIIPGSMGTASYLLVGTDGGAESLYSVNHGAGRVMSRMAAAGKVRRDGKIIKQGRITDEMFRESMKGVYLVCEDRHAIKEEAPDAYKDINEVIRVVVGAGLAVLVAKMAPLAVLKG